MNINSINNTQVQQSFRGKAPQKFVQIITEQRPVSQYTKDFLLPKINEVANIAKEYGKPIFLHALQVMPAGGNNIVLDPEEYAAVWKDRLQN